MLRVEGADFTGPGEMLLFRFRGVYDKLRQLETVSNMWVHVGECQPCIEVLDKFTKLYVEWIVDH